MCIQIYDAICFLPMVLLFATAGLGIRGKVVGYWLFWRDLGDLIRPIVSSIYNHSFRFFLLRPGMVISIGNCGLYLGDFGIRIEDTVAITDEGYEELTNYKRTL